MNAATRAARQARALAAFEQVEAQAERIIRRSFRRVLRKLRAHLGATVTAAGESVSYDDLAILFALWAEEVDGDLSTFFDRVFRAGAGGIEEQLPEAAAARLAQLGPEEMRRLLSAPSVAYMREAKNRLSGFGDEMWAEARDALAEGLGEGESVAELGGRLTGLLDVLEGRARSIARTEALTAMNQGALAEARGLGEYGPKTKIWLATDDDRTDEECMDLDGESVGLDEEFSSGDDAPPAHSLCRCTLVWGEAEGGEEADASNIDEALADTPAEEVPDEEPLELVAGGNDMKTDFAYDIVNNAEGCAPDTPVGVMDPATGAILSCWGSEEEAQAEVDRLVAEDQQGNAALGDDLAGAVAGPTAGGFHTLMVREGIETGDGRQFEAGSLEWRDLPIPLKWQREEALGHDGSVIVGRLDRIERQGADVHGWGVLDEGGDDGAEALRQIAGGFLRGISIDVDDVKDSDVELVWPEDPAGGEGEGLEMLMMEPEKIIFHHGRIAGATLCAIPAFQEAFIELDSMAPAASGDGGPPQAPDFKADETTIELSDDSLAAAAVDDGPKTGAMVALVPTDADAARLAVAGGEMPETLHVTLRFLGDSTAVTPEARAAILEGAERLASDQRPFSAKAFAPALFNPMGDEPCWVLVIGNDGGTFLDDVHCAVSPVVADAEATGWQAAADHAPWVPHLTLAYLSQGAAPSGEDLVAVVERAGMVTFDRIRVAFGEDDVHDFGFGEMLIPTTEDALVASAIPTQPPPEWFADPEFAAPQRNLIVTPEGRVMGHLFQWRQCHVSSGPFGQVCQMPPEGDDFSFFLTGDVLAADGELVPTGRLVMGMKHAARHLRAAAATAHYDDTTFARADVTIGSDRYGAWISGALRPETTPEQVRALRASSLSGDWRKIGGKLRLVGALVVNVPGFPIERPSAGVVAGDQVSLVAAGMVHDAPPDDDAFLSLADRIAQSFGRDHKTKAAQLAASIGR